MEQNAFYYRTEIPAGSYVGQEEAVPTFGVKCLICVDASMDETLVYALTRALWESADFLEQCHSSMSVMRQDGFMYQELPIPLHDGAARFYQEQKKLPSTTS